MELHPVQESVSFQNDLVSALLWIAMKLGNNMNFLVVDSSGRFTEAFLKSAATVFGDEIIQLVRRPYVQVRLSNGACLRSFKSYEDLCGQKSDFLITTPVSKEDWRTYCAQKSGPAFVHELRIEE